MAYMSITRRSKSEAVSVEIDRHNDMWPVDIWFGDNELYVSLTIAEAEELAHALMNTLREEALTA